MRVDHMDAELYIESTGSVQGTVQLTVQVLPAGTDSLQLHASELDIRSVNIGEQPAEFRFYDDQLWIYPITKQTPGELISLEIIYESSINFGIHKNENGTLFTSLLPKSTRHWLPALDLPVSEFTTDIRFIHPASKTLVASGQRISNRVLTVDQEETRYRSEYPIPAPELFFALGDLTIQTLEDQEPRLTIIHEIQEDGSILGLPDGEFSQERVDAIATSLAQASQEMRERTGRDYPHPTFQIIHLTDLVWEPRRLASGIHLFEEPEPPVEDVASAFLLQWTQSLIRPHRWSEAHAVHLISALALKDVMPVVFPDGAWNHRMGFGESETRYRIPADPLVADAVESGTGIPSTTPSVSAINSTNVSASASTRTDTYPSISVEIRKAAYVLERDPLFEQAVRRTLPILYQRSLPLLSWQELAQAVYTETGLSPMDLPEWILPPKQVKVELPYTATITPDETTGRVTVRFEAEDKPLEELQTVIVTEVGVDGLATRELEVTGAVSEWVITVSPFVETIVLTLPDGTPEERQGLSVMQIREQKPLTYWVAQYDYFTEDASLRKRAMMGLRDFRDNPDVQLAIRDRLETEADAEVLAEGLKTLAAVTNGAKGTETIFLDYLAPDKPVAVQKAAILALSNYMGHQEALRRLRVTVQRGDEPGIRKDAIRAMAAISDATLFRNSTERFLTDERLIDSVPLILGIMASKGETEQALTSAATFLSGAVPASVRLELLEWMLVTGEDSQYWEPKVGALVRDEDPRMRALAVWVLLRVDEGTAREWMGVLQAEEFDERVLAEVRRVEARIGL